MFNECVSDYTILAEYSICSGIAIAEGDDDEGKRGLCRVVKAPCRGVLQIVQPELQAFYENKAFR
jgi:hypothetical protein